MAHISHRILIYSRNDHRGSSYKRDPSFLPSINRPTNMYVFDRICRYTESVLIISRPLSCSLPRRVHSRSQDIGDVKFQTVPTIDREYEL